MTASPIQSTFTSATDASMIVILQDGTEYRFTRDDLAWGRDLLVEARIMDLRPDDAARALRAAKIRVEATQEPLHKLVDWIHANLPGGIGSYLDAVRG